MNKRRARPRRFVFCLSLPLLPKSLVFFSRLAAGNFSMKQLALSCFEYLNFARRCTIATRVPYFIYFTYIYTVQISISSMQFFFCLIRKYI